MKPLTLFVLVLVFVFATRLVASAQPPQPFSLPHLTYLPLVMCNYDPLLYDDFNNPAYDGSYDYAKWTFGGENYGVFQARQTSGSMVFTSSAYGGLSSINAYTQPLQRTWTQVQVFEAKLRMSSDRSGGESSVRIKVRSNDINGHAWETACVLSGTPNWNETGFSCYVQGGLPVNEYEISGPNGNYDAWNVVRIEANQTTAELRFYLNDVLLGSHMPVDAAALVTAVDLGAYVRVKNDDPGATSTRYVDDVRITPAQ